jgi:repressor LexA
MDSLMRESTRFEIDVPALLRALRKARGWNQEVLADQLETSQSAISRWEAGTSVPNGEAMLHIRALAEEAGLVGPHQPIRHGPSVPIVGRVGAGAVVEPEFEQLDPLDEIEIPFTFPDPVIAFEIAGDSMLPVYQDREIIVCLRDQVRPTESYLGRRAVVRTTRGSREDRDAAGTIS